MLRCYLPSVFLSFLAMLVVQADDVVLITSADGRSTLRKSGVIEDYSGEGLTLASSAGRKETIPLARIREIRVQRSDDELRGESLLASGKVEEAIAAFLAAKSHAERRWIARRIAIRLVGCYEQAEQFDRAGDEFLSVASDDPQTPYFAAIPLAWRTSAADIRIQSRAKAWLAKSNDPASMLLGASRLLGGADRSRAIEALQSLSNHTNSAIAHLATAQLWRTKTATADERETERWRDQIERMPTELRPGPNYVLGEVLVKLNRTDDALLAFLQTGLANDARPTLACDGLLAAARLMEKQTRTDDALRLYGELRTKHPALSKSADVEGRIAALQSTKGK